VATLSWLLLEAGFLVKRLQSPVLSNTYWVDLDLVLLCLKRRRDPNPKMFSFHHHFLIFFLKYVGDLCIIALKRRKSFQYNQRASGALGGQ
jgi:hypothetical protein